MLLNQKWHQTSSDREFRSFVQKTKPWPRVVCGSLIVDHKQTEKESNKGTSRACCKKGSISVLFLFGVLKKRILRRDISGSWKTDERYEKRKRWFTSSSYPHNHFSYECNWFSFMSFQYNGNSPVFSLLNFPAGFRQSTALPS